MLADVDRFCMQSDESARRIIDIGADPERVVVTGSLKFDSLEVPGASTAAERGRNRVLRYFRIAADRPVLIAASTLKGEEEPVFEAFRASARALPEALLIIAPRKPERFDEVEQLARRGGWNVVRRTELAVDAEPRADVVVLDTIGELAQLFQVATVVFVGGSLVDQGGHNILEPAVLRQADRLRPAHAELRRDRARRSSRTTPRSRSGPARELEHALLGLLADPVARARLGAAARALVEANRGARGKTLAAIAARAAAAGRRQRAPVPGGPLISTAYAAAARLRRRLLRAASRSAARSRSAGHQRRQPRRRRPRQDADRRARRRRCCATPASGRRSSAAATRRRDAADGVVVVSDGGGIRADLDRAGDEPLMLARQLDGVAVLVSSSRYLAGRLAETPVRRTVHVLDDGFQHLDLDRDVDLVVVAREDLERPDTLPFGRLREPLDAARRGRRDRGAGRRRRATAALGAPARPVWRARRRQGARGSPTPRAAGRSSAVAGDRVAGIASPAGFDARARLDRGRASWRFAIIIATRAADRRRASPARARAAGARRVVTTEKDAVRLLPFRPFAAAGRGCVPLTIELDDRRRRSRRGCSSALATRGQAVAVTPTLRHRVEYAAVDDRARRACGCCRCRSCWPPARSSGALFYAIDRPHRRLALRNLEAAFPGAVRRRVRAPSRATCSRTSAAC